MTPFVFKLEISSPSKVHILTLSFVCSILSFDLSGFCSDKTSEWKGAEPYRAVIDLPAISGKHNVVRAPMDFEALLKEVDSSEKIDSYTLRVEALDGPDAGKILAHRFETLVNGFDKQSQLKGELVFVVPDPNTRKVAVYFGGRAVPLDQTPLVPLIGDGDIMRVAGTGNSVFPYQACYPEFLDMDGDGKRDLLGSDRYGTGSKVTWFRNIGTDSTPAFSEREVYPVRTNDGKTISNPNNGWLLTSLVMDWDGDGAKDLLVGGWCRFLTFYKNTASAGRFSFAPGKVIFDAKIFPGDDAGPKGDPNTPFQGVFMDPCDWDDDGKIDLICGTYYRKKIYFLKNTGNRDVDGIPLLGEPIALEVNGEPIKCESFGPISAQDWNGDGKPDIITQLKIAFGHAGFGYVFHENIGTRSAPKLAPGKPLIDANQNVMGERYCHGHAKIVDWNKDGKQDLFASSMDSCRLFINTGTASEPKLVETTIPYRSQPMCQGSSFAYPVACDLDRDGMTDLTVGDQRGNVLFFKRLKGNLIQFAEPVKLKSKGVEIHETGCPDGGESKMGYIKISLADWNGDSFPDIIMWTMNGPEGWQKGSLDPNTGWCLKFFAGMKDPLEFEAPVEIKANDKHIMAGYRTTPSIIDLDGDGLLDLIAMVSNEGKVASLNKIMFYKNVGTTKEWKLTDGIPLTFENGAPISSGVRRCARFADWDGDGDLDMFISYTGLDYYENIGNRTKPIFKKTNFPKLLEEKVQSHHEIGIDIHDYDGDGMLDLLAGSGDSGLIHYFRRTFIENQPQGKANLVEKKR